MTEASKSTDTSKEKIISAIDSITPGKGAEKRMYENILKKAEGSRSGLKAARIIKPFACAAAGVCVVTSVALFLRMQLNNADNLSSGVGMAFDEAASKALPVLTTALSEFIAEGNNILYDENNDLIVAEEGGQELAEIINDSFYDETGNEENEENEEIDVIVAESAAEVIFNVPEGANDVVYDETENMRTGEFIFDKHCYSFSVSDFGEELNDSSIKNDDWTEQEEVLSFSDVNAVLYSLENESDVIYKVCWESGGHMFSLINSDGADKSEFIDIFKKSVKIN